jgi:hypothetical protein
MVQATINRRLRTSMANVFGSHHLYISTAYQLAVHNYYFVHEFAQDILCKCLAVMIY